MPTVRRGEGGNFPARNDARARSTAARAQAGRGGSREIAAAADGMPIAREPLFRLMLGFALDFGDARDRLDQRVWRAVGMRLLARAGEGLAVCDAELRVLQATPLGLHLLGRIGASAHGRLPEKLASAVNQQLASNDISFSARILTSRRSGSAVLVHAAPIAGAPPAHAMLFLREEALRDDVLYMRMREELPISRRGFQLALLVRKGLSNREIADRLNLTESTVKVYLHHLYRDCGVSSRTALVALLARFSR